MERKWLAVGIILLFVGSCIIPANAQDTEKSQSTTRGNWLYVDEPNGWLNEPPVADFSWWRVNLFAHFNASSSYDVDGYITSWFWEFGDGTVETGEIVDHIFHSSGIYNVTLTVTDDDGEQDSIVQEFTINYKPQNRTTFIFGKITNLSYLEEFTLFRAEKILMITFSPFVYSGIQGTRFIIYNEYQGLVGAKYIFVLCKILCDY